MTTPTDEQLAQALVNDGIGEYLPVKWAIGGHLYFLGESEGLMDEEFVCDPRVADAVMDKGQSISIFRGLRGKLAGQWTVDFSPHSAQKYSTATDPNRSRAICLAYCKAMGEKE